MKQGQSSANFDLLELEPRVLLSTAPLPVAVGAAFCQERTTSPQPAAEEIRLAQGHESIGSATSYQPSVSILPGQQPGANAKAGAPVETGANDSHSPTSNPRAQNSDPVAQVRAEVTQSSATASSQRQVNSPGHVFVPGAHNPDLNGAQAAQLIETLRSANGPPGTVTLQKTSQGVAVLTLDTTADGVLRVSGTVNGLAFAPVSLPGVRELTIDTSTASSPGDTVVLKDLRGSGVQRVHLRTGSGDDSLQIDGTWAASGEPQVDWDGGQGSNTLNGPVQDTTWNVTGVNAGNVTGVSFHNVENLVGAANNRDTFIFASVASISGGIAGGAGGFDTLVVQGVSQGSYLPGRVFGDGTIQYDQKRISFTGLEPVLIDGSVSGTPSTFTFTTQGGTDQIVIDSPAANENRISGTSDGVAFESVTFINVRQVVVDTGTNDAAGRQDDVVRVTAPLVASGLQSLVIETGAGNDTVDLSGLPAANTVQVQIDGGDGVNTLLGPVQDSTWDITARDAGTLNSSVHFSAIECLTGAADNEDTFNLEPGGSLDGYLDGGAGGFDLLDINGGSYGHLAFGVAGANSGTIALDGTTLHYFGLEPVVSTGTATDASFVGTANADDIHLKDGPNANQLTIESDNPAAPFESLTFTSPTNSLTISGGAGDDRIQVDKLKNYSGILSVDGGTGTNTLATSSVDVLTMSTLALLIGTEAVGFTNIQAASLIGSSYNTAPPASPFAGTVAFTTALPNWISNGPGPIQNGQSAGIPNQPVDGAVNAIAVDSAHPGTVYIGSTAGGIWKTTNGNTANPTWTPLTDQLPSMSITALTIDPTSNGQILYAGTGDASSSRKPGGRIGLLKSIDAGQTWTVIPAVFAAPFNRQIYTIYARGTLVLVGCDSTAYAPGKFGGGLERSTNGGLTFKKISGSGNLPDGTVQDIKVDPGNQSRFYATVPGQGAYRSDDGGVTWNPFNTGLAGAPGALRIELSVSGTTDPGTGNYVVYAGVISPVQDTITAMNVAAGQITVNNIGLFEIGDGSTAGGFLPGLVIGGANPQPVQITGINRGTGVITLASLAANHSLGDSISIPGRYRVSGVFRSNDLGVTWTSMGTPGDADGGISPGGQGDLHFSILADQSSSNVVFVGGDRQIRPTGAFPNTAGATNWTGRLFQGVFNNPGSSWSAVTDNGASGIL